MDVSLTKLVHIFDFLSHELIIFSLLLGEFGVHTVYLGFSLLKQV
jgi:hypothetical protein